MEDLVFLPFQVDLSWFPRDLPGSIIYRPISDEFPVAVTGSFEKQRYAHKLAGSIWTAKASRQIVQASVLRGQMHRFIDSSKSRPCRPLHGMSRATVTGSPTVYASIPTQR